MDVDAGAHLLHEIGNYATIGLLASPMVIAVSRARRGSLLRLWLRLIYESMLCLILFASGANVAAYAIETQWANTAIYGFASVVWYCNYLMYKAICRDDDGPWGDMKRRITSRLKQRARHLASSGAQ